MGNFSKSEISNLEVKNSWWQLSIWTLLPAAAAIGLLSWMIRRRPSVVGRKQSQQQGDDDYDDDHQKSPTKSIDSDEHGSPRCEVSSVDNVVSGREEDRCELSSEDNVVSGREEDRDGPLLPEKKIGKRRVFSYTGGKEVGKLERFKVKPRGFMNVSTKNNN